MAEMVCLSGKEDRCIAEMVLGCKYCKLYISREAYDKLLSRGSF